MRKRKNLAPRLERVGALLWPRDAAAFAGGRPLIVEIGCGMGGFVTALAGAAGSGGAFLAVERDANVAVRAMERVREAGLDNVRFLLADAGQLAGILERGSVDTLYLNFSDPWPHRRHAHRRLTHRRYLRLYQILLKPGGTLAFKTDNRDLFRFTRHELEAENWRITALDEDLPDGPDNIPTEYEARFRESGRPIFHIQAAPGSPPEV
ncbi:MAG: tRNA (guanosine(46)-N7)-methyltransferase TrmB [Oscillospiraceae bacterium]|nr:tRNA (guanosine(46)-N7)-methyltransferase TrmB [Oscillospiraceae bacterium]